MFNSSQIFAIASIVFLRLVSPLKSWLSQSFAKESWLPDWQACIIGNPLLLSLNSNLIGGGVNIQTNLGVKV